MMRRIFPLLLLAVVTVTGCSKKAKTASNEPSAGRPVAPAQTDRNPVFVSDRTASEPAEKSSVVDIVESAPVAELIAPISFAARETEHVRIVDYNPFGNDEQLMICLDELGRHFCYPYPGNKISDYGMRGRAMHTGLDIKAIPNDTIRAALSGVVRMSKLYSGYGNIVVIRHPCGLETAYSHNSKNLVSPNDVVKAGDPIALAGRTGRATTEHLHFEARIMGEHFDPNLILDTQNRTIKSGNIYLTRRNGRIIASRSADGNAPAEPATLVASNSRPAASPSNTSPSTAVSQRNSASSAAVSGSSSTALHTVQRGDTLYSISRRYGLTIDQICALNGISRDGVLSIGQKIKLK